MSAPSYSVNAPYVHSLQHLNAALQWTRCGLSVDDDQPLTTDFAEEATCPWCFTNTTCPKVEERNRAAHRLAYGY